MKCCNAKSNSLYQVCIAIQDKLIVQYFVITMCKYRSEHAGVSLWQRKPQVHQSYQLLHSAVLTGAVFME